jgi:hypothetical protein
MNAQEAISKRREHMPKQYRKGYDEAMKGESRSAAMKAHCYQCMGWEDSPANCTCPACALFKWRPMGRAKTGKPMSEENREKARKRLMAARSTAIGA